MGSIKIEDTLDVISRSLKWNGDLTDEVLGALCKDINKAVVELTEHQAARLAASVLLHDARLKAVHRAGCRLALAGTHADDQECRRHLKYAETDIAKLYSAVMEMSNTLGIRNPHVEDLHAQAEELRARIGPEPKVEAQPVRLAGAAPGTATRPAVRTAPASQGLTRDSPVPIAPKGVPAPMMGSTTVPFFWQSRIVLESYHTTGYSLLLGPTVMITMAANQVQKTIEVWLDDPSAFVPQHKRMSILRAGDISVVHYCSDSKLVCLKTAASNICITFAATNGASWLTSVLGRPPASGIRYQHHNTLELTNLTTSWLQSMKSNLRKSSQDTTAILTPLKRHASAQPEAAPASSSKVLKVNPPDETQLSTPPYVVLAYWSALYSRVEGTEGQMVFGLLEEEHAKFLGNVNGKPLIIPGSNSQLILSAEGLDKIHYNETISRVILGYHSDAVGRANTAIQFRSRDMLRAFVYRMKGAAAVNVRCSEVSSEDVITLHKAIIGERRADGLEDGEVKE